METAMEYNPVGLDGMEFIEFTSPDLGILERMMDRLGLQLVAKHKTRHIRLFRQNGINFLINDDANSGREVPIATTVNPMIRSLIDSRTGVHASPRPEIRSKAALLVGAILEGPWGEGSATPGADLVPQVVGLARRDPIVDVRVDATRALGRIPGTIATESLREIAEQDDSQDVRYEAKRLLLERAGPRP